MTSLDKVLFIERLHSVVQEFGERPAVIVDGVTKLTYRELWTAAGRIAAGLQRSGIGHRSTVAIMLPKSAELIASQIGVWRCGAAWLPIEPTLPETRIRYLIADSNSNLLICTRSQVANYDQAVQVERLLNAPQECPAPDNTDHSDLAYVIYTSGTTGQPKGVEVTHRGLVSMLSQQIKAIELTPHSKSLFLLSPSFDAAVSDIGTALLSGASLCIEPSLHRNSRLSVSPRQLTRLMEARGITYVDIPPALLARLDPDDCPVSLKSVLIGGEVCPANVVRAWADRVRLINVYGPTEATVCTSLSICDPQTWNRPFIGQPLAGVEYLIDGGTNEGELLIGGRCLARGYRNRPELTARKFVDRQGRRFYRTGDRVRLEPDGQYVFLGRLDRQIKLRGHRIEPGEVEATICEHSDVERAAVSLRKSKCGNANRLVAYISTVNAKNATKICGELRERLLEKLPAYSLPSHFYFVDSLPLTVSGKIDYGQLAKLDLDSTPQAEHVTQSTDEDRLLGIFQQVLGHQHFSADDHFISAGGDSLGVVEVCALAQVLGVPLSPEQVLSLGSVNEICRCLRSTDPLERFEYQTADELRADVAKILKTNAITASATTPAQLNHFLLTGATGFLGIRLLAQLLEDPQARVTCLVRAKDGEHATRRIAARLRESRLVLADQARSRITVVAGNVSLKNLGLRSDDYRRLADQIDRVVHAAAEVNVVATYRNLRATNLIGVNQVANFVATGCRKTLDYVSTLSVFVGTDRFQGNMLESDDLSRTRSIYGGYAQTKWAAEVLLRSRAEVHQVTRYLRLGLLTTDTRTKISPPNDLLTLTVQGLLELGAFPVGDKQLKIDITPVDYAARVLTKIIRAHDTDDRVFHVAHPSGLLAERLFAELQGVLSEIKAISPAEFESRVRNSQISWRSAAACLALSRRLTSKPITSPHPFDLFQATGTRFDMANTDKQLVGSNLAPPKLDGPFIKDMLAAILQTNTVTSS